MIDRDFISSKNDNLSSERGIIVWKRDKNKTVEYIWICSKHSRWIKNGIDISFIHDDKK